VERRPRTEGEFVAVSVRDHGIGIAKADRTRVFERFYKTDRARVRGGGTGLGLSIARHVVQGHGGRIGVESEEGEGSTFTSTIPLRAPDPAATTPPRPTTAA
jgi:two-component system phosphate regulon sensor histidine kinase PhoR